MGNEQIVMETGSKNAPLGVWARLTYMRTRGKPCNCQAWASGTEKIYNNRKVTRF